MWGGLFSPYPPAAAHQEIFLCFPGLPWRVLGQHMYIMQSWRFSSLGADHLPYLGYGKGEKVGVSNGASTGSRKGWVIKSGWPAHCCHHYPKTPHHPVVPSFGSLSRCFFPCISMKGGPNPDRLRPPPTRTVPYPPAISSCAQRYWARDKQGACRRETGYLFR